MIHTNPSLRPAVLSVSNRPASSQPAIASPNESFEPQLGFEPWIGPGKPGHPEPSAPQPAAPPQPSICPQPTMGFEPWLSGETTTTPAVSPRFSDKLVRAFGEQALTSIDDSRIKGCAGYYFDGLESVQPSQDWLTGVTVGRLGDQWEMTTPGTYELKTQGLGQTLRFDTMTGQTVLESYYDVQSYETSRHSEILRLDRDGTMRRETPPVGL